MDLVSCVLPTRNRAAWISAAIACFQSQTYPERELVIVDHGTDDTARLIPPDPRIRYTHLSDQTLTTGEMRNACAEHARGTILCHFDSDDWSAPTRVADQVARLRDDQVTGYHTLLFYDTRTGKVYQWSPTTSYVLGTSLCYRRTWWQAHPFPALRVGEDLQFFRTAARHTRVRAVASRLLVARVHADQTWVKTLQPPRYQPKPRAALPPEFPCGSI